MVMRLKLNLYVHTYIHTRVYMTYLYALYFCIANNNPIKIYISYILHTHTHTHTHAYIYTYIHTYTCKKTRVDSNRD